MLSFLAKPTRTLTLRALSTNFSKKLDYDGAIRSGQRGGSLSDYAKVNEDKYMKEETAKKIKVMKDKMDKVINLDEKQLFQTKKNVLKD